MTILSVEGLDLRHGQLQAVRDVSFSLVEGETLALFGANGAGKTTLLRAIAGAHPIRAGRVLLDGRDVSAMPAHARSAMGIALVPEGRRLFQGMSVEDNLRVALSAGRPGYWTLDTVLEAFPNLRARRKSAARTLSGGEQQAAAIGRALMTNPRVLLLDEVSLGLSPAAVDRVYESLKGLVKGGATIVLVEQDLARTMAVSDRIICMLEGRVALEGRARDLSREQISSAYFGLRRPHAQGAVAP